MRVDRLLDPILSIAVRGAVLAVLGAFGLLLADLVTGGWPALSASFLLAPVRDAGRAGGIGPVLVSTLLVLAVSLLAALPLGLGAAVFLAGATGRSAAAARPVRASLDVLSGVPSIVFGLFGNVFFSKVLGLGFSILSGGLTLAGMILPLFVRLAEEGLRAVPDDLHRTAAALGLSRTTTLRRVLLPAAAPAILAGLILSVGRALAETAALIFTSGYVDRMPTSLFDSGRTLSVHIWDLSMNVPGGDTNAYGAALVLLALLIAVNATASGLTRRIRRSLVPR